jgi:hypothetical protein
MCDFDYEMFTKETYVSLVNEPHEPRFLDVRG